MTDAMLHRITVRVDDRLLAQIDAERGIAGRAECLRESARRSLTKAPSRLPQIVEDGPVPGTSLIWIGSDAAEAFDALALSRGCGHSEALLAAVAALEKEMWPALVMPGSCPEHPKRRWWRRRKIVTVRPHSFVGSEVERAVADQRKAAELMFEMGVLTEDEAKIAARRRLGDR